MTFIRATTFTTGQVADAILSYAKYPQLKHLRLALTERYVDPSELPPGITNHSLIHNSPLLIAVAVIDQPYVTNNTMAVVIDSPGLTMRRNPRDQEVIQLTSDLLALGLPSGKLGYGVQPVSATEHLTPDAAAQAILAADYHDFLTAQHGTDLQRRMG